ncbi:D-aspartate oxidase isoform X2 [Vanacampus margaritifer]
MDVYAEQNSSCQIFREPPANKTPYWWDIVFGFRFLSERELRRFPEHSFGQAFTTIKCECSSYLPWLRHRFTKAGGNVEQKKLSSFEELSPYYDIIVNCSGLGSKELVGDDGVYPVRGQILKVDAPWVQYFIRDGDGKSYVYPGSSYVTLGGTRQEGDWRLGADAGESEAILERCARLEPSVRRGRVLGQWVGLRPGRRNPRVEREVLRLGGGGGGGGAHVVHNYGHGGCGVTLAWGTALDATRLVRSCLQEMHPHAKL